MNKHLLPLLLPALLALAPVTRAEINVPSDGSDGVFWPLSNIVINLDEAVTGTWNQNNSANAGRGVYDPNQWAVVFKFQSVVIPSNVTVRFANHRSRAPVVWLVESNVVINGTVNLDGQDGSYDASLTHVNIQGGPGGFRGGLGYGTRNGLGPAEGYYVTSFGNPQIVPLIGGPGNGEGNVNFYPPIRRAGGGGAILIASRFNIILTGQVTARGGIYNNGGPQPTFGGAIRFVCDEILGNGTLDASSGGRIRIEANAQRMTHPSFADWLAPRPADANGNVIIWPPADAPKATILSLTTVTNGVTVSYPSPAEPLAPLNGTPDLLIQTTNIVEILVETLNFPIEGSVNVRVIPKGNDASLIGARWVSGNFARALWKATNTMGTAYTTLQVRAYAP